MKQNNIPPLASGGFMMFHDSHLVGPPVLEEFVLKLDAHGTLQPPGHII